MSFLTLLRKFPVLWIIVAVLFLIELHSQATFTVTTNYGLRKPDPHTQGWADLVNQNMDDIDDLLSGARVLVNLKSTILSIGAYNFVPTFPAASRNMTLADPGRDATMAMTFNSSGGYYQTKGVAGCATAATQFATCDTTLTWFSGWSSAAYKVTCTGE